MPRVAKENPELKASQDEIWLVTRALLILTVKDLMECEYLEVKKATFSYMNSNKYSNHELKITSINTDVENKVGIDKEVISGHNLSKRMSPLHDKIRSKYPLLHKLKILGEVISYEYDCNSWEFDTDWARAKALEYISAATLDKYSWTISFAVDMTTHWTSSSEVYAETMESALACANKTNSYLGWYSEKNEKLLPRYTNEVIKLGYKPVAKKKY